MVIDYSKWDNIDVSSSEEDEESSDPILLVDNACVVDDDESGTDENKDETSTSSWRVKSIEEFRLQPVPEDWRDDVAVGSEESWKNYYEYRIRVERQQSDYYDNGEEKEFMKEWKEAMSEKISTFSDCKWHWTPKFGTIWWSDLDSIETAEYYCHVWSPFAIPHAIALEHRYHIRAGYDSAEFHTVWNYCMLNVGEGENVTKKKSYVELCSNCYEDEELRFPVIQTSNLNMITINAIRKFLFGSSTAKSKELTYTDYDFLLLLFGSMGTTEEAFGGDLKRCDLGYIWAPYFDETLIQKLLNDKVPANDDPEGEAPKSKSNYFYSHCSWLRHRILEITGKLGPLTKHYQHPTVEKSPGYKRSDNDDDDCNW